MCLPLAAGFCPRAVQEASALGFRTTLGWWSHGLALAMFLLVQGTFEVRCVVVSRFRVSG